MHQHPSLSRYPVTKLVQMTTESYTVVSIGLLIVWNKKQRSQNLTAGPACPESWITASLLWDKSQVQDITPISEWSSSSRQQQRRDDSIHGVHLFLPNCILQCMHFRSAEVAKKMSFPYWVFRSSFPVTCPNPSDGGVRTAPPSCKSYWCIFCSLDSRILWMSKQRQLRTVLPTLWATAWGVTLCFCWNVFAGSPPCFCSCGTSTGTAVGLQPIWRGRLSLGLRSDSCRSCIEVWRNTETIKSKARAFTWVGQESRQIRSCPRLALWLKE